MLMLILTLNLNPIELTEVKVMAFLNQYIKKYRGLFLAAILFLVIEAVCDLLQPTIMARIIDIGVVNGDLSYVFRMGGTMLLITAIGATGAIIRNIISSYVSQRFGTDLRSDLFKKIQTFSFDNLNQFETASLITRLTNDVKQIQDFSHRMMRIFVKAPILSIGSLIMAFLLDPTMSLVLVLVVPIVGILIALNLKIGYPFFRRVQRAMDRLNSVLREYLAGVRVVKAFNRFDYESKRFSNVNQELSAISENAMRMMAVFSPAITLTVNIGIVAVLWFGGLSVNAGKLEVGKTIALINYMTQILHSLMMVSVIFNMLVRARASAERVDEVFRQENDIVNGGKGIEIPTPQDRGRIDFENVSFSYSDASEEPVLKDISFTCLPGETVGIIGSTGSGKSTLVNLIPRFFDVTLGTVRVNGIDVRKLNTMELRKRISIVQQKTVLFTGTIFENIQWGKEQATEEEVFNAAKLSQIDDFISTLPLQYDTLLGQGGVNLSGGQKQRISIARALVRNPEILILDDSTSAIDTTTETCLREALKEFSKELTCLIIAQRITSVLGADKILVLDNGNLVGMGTHRELMEKCRVYQDIFYSQLGKEGI